MRKRLEEWMPWIGLGSVTALGLGVTLALADAAGWLPGRQYGRGVTANVQQSAFSEADPDSLVLALALQPREQREESLAVIAAQPPSAEQLRARYLLASDLVAQGRDEQAVPILEALSEEYPELEAYARIKLGKAQKGIGELAIAQETWETVLQEHGDQPAAAEALFQLGQQQPEYWDQLLQRFPDHPRSVEVAAKKLSEETPSSNKKDWLLVITRHGIYRSDSLAFVDRLVDNYGEQLTAEEWQDVGFAYWERLSYKAAGKAYSQAPASPQTLYRAARGSQLGQQRAAAIAYYNALNAQFPEAPETGLGLMRLSALVDEETALPLLDQVIQRFPDRAGEALVEKAKIMETLNSPDTAVQIRKTILAQYSQSEEAAELRSQYARNAGQAGNWSGALQWADQLLEENADSELAPEIGFWSAKWALRAGQTKEASQRFEQVIRTYPESYFAWRSAASLGWDVGDFRTVRSLQPDITLPTRRQPLPVGSTTLQELYLLGQDQDAWSLWQVEFDNRQDPSVEEQFTDGVLRVGVGDNLDGIFMVSSLSWRDEPQEKATHQTLQEHPAYWQTLYPFPYANLIADWSAKRDLNPLLVTALIRQESRFQPQIRSVVGAAGLMQVMPDTAEWIQAQTDIAAYNLDDPNSNIELGTWYLDYTHEEYGNHSLYAVASYNAGPGNVADWIARRNYTDEDDFADKIPFPETKDYIRSVFGGYWNYLRLYNPDIARRIEILQRSGDSLK
ncbi:transglycosylase SLT domain-containing protein [Oscillatoria sp. CS-180]|uniref:transglycosylase SLT domain-containing protein n=1 Tax=Oscillatoria sp. CS-180 TaxID=3021720 RepID=UPI0023310314|nr:transglycosylase SLT domain-containing protein [Oscillatoria sp. CS-180]MDB9527065.1 transglycosylase SLT domain-containing protein [Oscillatoria sp. CS-180]